MPEQADKYSTQKKYLSSQNALNHLKSEMEQRLREKDDELENLRLGIEVF